MGKGQAVEKAIRAGDLVPDYGTTTDQVTFTITNDTQDRTFDADTVAVAELADIVATLLKDLAARGILKTA